MAILSRYVPVDLSGRRALVAGGSIAGLAAALALAERGAEVLVIEPDAGLESGSIEDAFLRGSRRHVPQIRHSHAFLARLRAILVRAYPDFYAELLAAGALEIRLLDFPPPSLGRVEPAPGDEDLVTLGCRRTTFEWVLRRYAATRPGIAVLAGATVEGLVARPGHPPHVVGARVRSDGRTRSVAADLVIDASGRGSNAARWLADLGAALPEEIRSPSSILYYTRFYRRHESSEFPPPGREPTMADFGWIKYAVFPADARSYSITFATHLSLPRFKVLSDGAAFEEMARSLPGIARFVDAALGAPLPVMGRDVLAMGGLENRCRRFVDRDARPLAAGLFVVGDAAYHTNPLYGRGTSQAFMHAGLLGEALDAAAGDPVRAAGHFDALARAEIEPFYRASVVADAVASRKVGAAPRSLRSRLYDTFFDEGVIPATRCDPVVFRAFVRMMNMIDTPERAFFAPGVLERVLAFLARDTAARAAYAPTVPDRDATLARLEAAAGLAERCADLA